MLRQALHSSCVAAGDALSAATFQLHVSLACKGNAAAFAAALQQVRAAWQVLGALNEAMHVPLSSDIAIHCRCLPYQQRLR